MSKSIRDIRQEKMIEYNTINNKFEDFQIGDRVKVITPSQDFHFFYEETGKVIKNSYKYLGICVEFDEPRVFEDGYIQKGFNFEPEDLFLLKTIEKPFHRIVERNYPY
jgi:hypothetical protein